MMRTYLKEGDLISVSALQLLLLIIIILYLKPILDVQLARYFSNKMK